MCGLAGFVGSAHPVRAQERVQRMLGALERRGPDGEGIEGWDGAVLGHRRLAIFDLSDAGRQPMMTADRSLGVVFNGAIYNFRELRAELEAGSGAVFRSNTDTEVLLHGYRRWGIDGLAHRLRGMFAFGLWDERERKLFLVRDRLGVKPLLYRLEKGSIAFASTAAALRAGDFASEIDDAAVAEFLEFGYVTDERSIYEGVKKLPAATLMEWHEGVVRTREYWRPPVAEPVARRSFAEVVEEAESLLLKAVERRLQADVTVGTLLSGGIDSGLVCWAVKQLGGDLTAFTVGTPGEAWDESQDAIDTARKLGIRHQLVELSPSSLPEIDDLLAAYAEPFGCASALGMIAVSGAVAPSATVLLTGDGGDDVFLGYPQHRFLGHAQRLARALPGATLPLWRLARKQLYPIASMRRVVHFVDYSVGGLGAYVNAHDGLPGYRARGWLGDRLADASVRRRAIPWTTASARNVLAEYLEHDRHNQFVAEYMTKVDGGTMFHALEARSPFLDQDLWEFAASLPYSQRLHGGELKSVLRAIARRRIGERAATGSKRGFRIPVQRWVAGRWSHLFRDLLDDGLVARQGWIRPGPVLRDFQACVERGWAPHQFWYLLVLESWLRRERSPAPLLAAATG